MSDFAGRWATSFGPMTLVQDGSSVTGSYGRGAAANTLKGKVEAGRLVFAYREAREQGTGWFELVRDGHFLGEYLAEGAVQPQPWTGNRGFDGIWSTSLGPLRLVQEGDLVRGGSGDGVMIDGRIEAGRLAFRDILPGHKGEGHLELSADGYEIAGSWCGVDTPEPLALTGTRAEGQPRTLWLIVLEAHWQRSLAEREFAFGGMLREIFARLPQVHVRHRYFQDEESLLHWCRALQLLAEPVVLVITSHGEAAGISVMGRIINSRRIIETLELADNLRLVHFSCCLIANGGEAGLANRFFPVSGYTSSVDWMASALTEFTYLDMILGKGLTPERAAEQVRGLIGFAGEAVPPGCPYPAAGFQLVLRIERGAVPAAAAGQMLAAVGSAGGERSLLDRLGGIRDLLSGRG